MQHTASYIFPQTRVSNYLNWVGKPLNWQPCSQPTWQESVTDLFLKWVRVYVGLCIINFWWFNCRHRYYSGVHCTLTWVKHTWHDRSLSVWGMALLVYPWQQFELYTVDPLHWKCRFSISSSNLPCCSTFHGITSHYCSTIETCNWYVAYYNTVGRVNS